MKTGPFNTFDNYVNSFELQLKRNEENSKISVVSYEKDKPFYDKKNLNSSEPHLESSYAEEEAIVVEEHHEDLPKNRTKNELEVKKLRKAIHSGELIERVERHGNEVKLFVEEAYKKFYGFHRLNINLGLMYEQSSDFQRKFEKPYMGKDEKNLQLRQDHGYVDDAEILADLKRFAARKTRVCYRRLLVQGKLFVRIEKSSQHEREYHLVPRDKYNTPENIMGINNSISFVYKDSDQFRSKYFLKTTANKLFTLELKSKHPIQEDEILADIIAYAKSKRVYKTKTKRMNKTSNVTKTKLNKDIKHVKYNDVDENISITSELNLESYQEQAIDVDEYQYDLTERDNISLKKLKNAIHSGNFFERVERDGDQVKLFIKEPYKSNINFYHLNQVLYRIHRSSSDFKRKFKKPRESIKEQMLQLLDEHGYVDDAEILADIIRFTARKEGKPYKALLAEGDLFERAEKSSEDVGVYHLVLKDEYKMPENIEGINQAIKSIYSSSDEFRSEYSLVNNTNMLFTLKVKAPEHIQDDNKVLSDLALYAAKTTIIKKRKRLDDDALITISNESENNDINQPSAKIARRDQPEIHNVEARINNGQFLILFQQKAYVNNAMDIDQSSRDLAMHDTPKKRRRSEDEKDYEPFDIDLPKMKKPCRDQLKSDTAEGRKSEGKFIFNFSRKAKEKAIGNIKSQIAIDEEQLAYIAEEPLLIRFKTSDVRSALAELFENEKTQTGMSPK